MAAKLAHLKELKDLYFLKSDCLQAELRGIPFGAAFWTSINRNNYKTNRGRTLAYDPLGCSSHRPHVWFHNKGAPTMTTMLKKPEKQGNVEVLRVDQRRPKLERFRLQVDRQTKASFDSLEGAETAAKNIKTAHPIVQVVIYDADKHQQRIVE